MIRAILKFLFFIFREKIMAKTLGHKKNSGAQSNIEIMREGKKCEIK